MDKSKKTHLQNMHARSIDCFCLPDECAVHAQSLSSGRNQAEQACHGIPGTYFARYTFCKRSGFDGEEVCKAFA